MGNLLPSKKKDKAVPMPKARAATPDEVRGALERLATKAANKKAGSEGSQSEANKMSAKERKALGKKYDRELEKQRLKSWTT